MVLENILGFIVIIKENVSSGVLTGIGNAVVALRALHVRHVIQRCQPGTTICKIMIKNPYNLQKNPYKLSTPLQKTILV